VKRAKLVEPNAVDWHYTQIWRIRLLARLGQVDEAWSRYDEFAASPMTTARERISVMAIMALGFKEHGSSTAAHDAAIKAQQLLESLSDSTIDTTESQEIINGILAPSTRDTKDSDGLKSSNK
jgi:hypothetical protein